MAKNKLFQQAVHDTLLLSDRQQISRDIPLVNARNYKMICRFYWYTFLKGVKNEVALKGLSMEFFLKGKTIKKIIMSREEELETLIKEKPTVEWFKKEWEYLEWDTVPNAFYK